MAEPPTEPQAPPAESQAAPATGLEPESDDWEAESALGESIASSTTSINSSILKYREENGRTYHAYKVHLLANNFQQEINQERMEIMHSQMMSARTIAWICSTTSST
jgi:hypothetical protein